MPTSASRPASSHRSACANWASPSFSPVSAFEQRHRHVEVGAARVERGLEDRRVEARVDGVEDRVHAFGARELRDRRRVGCVDGCGAQALVAVGLDRPASAILVDVREHHPLEEATALRHRGDRSSHST